MKKIKIKQKNRKWILHYNRLGRNHENFGVSNGMNGYWPQEDDGVSSVQAFAHKESSGKLVATKCPESIARLTAGKAIHGMTVQMWAEDWNSGMLPDRELREYCNEVPGLYDEVMRIASKLHSSSSPSSAASSQDSPSSSHSSGSPSSISNGASIH